jgi:adhesin/invasin
MEKQKKIIRVFFFLLFFSVPTEVFSQSQTKSIVEDAYNLTISKITSFIKIVTQSYLDTLFPTVEIQANTGLTNALTGGILIVTPLFNSKNIYNTTFLQGSLFLTREDRYRQTLNVGLGERFLLMDKKLLVGFNSFYNHEFPYNHKRASFGFETRSSVGEINANKYYRLSTWNGGYNGIQEKALDGQDIEIGVPLPYINWTKAYLKKFKWESPSGSSDSKGDQFSLRASLPFGFSIEGGRKSYSTAFKSDENFFKLTWNLNTIDNDKSLTISNEAYVLSAMENGRYTKVRNEDLITKSYKITATTTTSADLPTGYIVRVGLTWAPMTTSAQWGAAQTICSNSTALGFSAGTWRTPSLTEIQSLRSVITKTELVDTHGWIFTHIFNIWSNTSERAVNINSGNIISGLNTNNWNVVCVHI